MSRYRATLIELIKDRGCVPRDDVVTLSAGGQTDVYLDMPRVLDDGIRLRLAASVLTDWIELHCPELPTAIGAPQTSADALLGTMVSRSQANWRWFTVRKRFKEHGIPGWIQGAELTAQDSVVLIDDVVNTGRSLRTAIDWVTEETKARILAVIPLVDRAGIAAAEFDAIGVPYWPVMTYRDLDLPAIIQKI